MYCIGQSQAVVKEIENFWGAEFEGLGAEVFGKSSS